MSDTIHIHIERECPVRVITVEPTGARGAAGTSATVAVGTTTTGAAGTNASVTNSGTTSAAVFNFTIPRGDTGAAGASGGSSTAWRYRAKTNATSGYPTNGHLLWNNATQTSATEILVSHLDDEGTDIELFLSFFLEGQKIFIQNRDDSSQNQVWEITGTPTVTGANTSTAYYTFPVTLVSSAGAAFTNNHSILFGSIAAAVNAVTSATTSDGTANLSIADLEVVGGEIYTDGDYSQIYTQGTDAHIFTLGSGAEIFTEGELAQIYTTGASAQIYTAGAGATIGTQGANATIYTTGTNATISTAGSAAHIQTSHASAAVKSTNFAAVESGGASLVDGSMQPCLTWSAGGRNLTIPSGTATTFNTTSYTYGTGAAAAHRDSLGLTTLATTTPAANVATFLATPTSTNLAAAVTDETGTGSLVFGTSPSLTSPTIGTSATFNATTYTYGAGAAAAHRTALEFDTLLALKANLAGGNTFTGAQTITGASLTLQNAGAVTLALNDTSNANIPAFNLQQLGTTRGRIEGGVGLTSRLDFSVGIPLSRSMSLNQGGTQNYGVTIGRSSIAGNVAPPTDGLHVQGTVAIGTTTPSAKAILDLTSTTKGFLPPRMTTTERNAITSVPAGLMIYNTSLNKLNVYNGTTWETVTSL